jgi:hypothetical protein
VNLKSVCYAAWLAILFAAVATRSTALGVIGVSLAVLAGLVIAAAWIDYQTRRIERESAPRERHRAGWPIDRQSRRWRQEGRQASTRGPVPGRLE